MLLLFTALTTVLCADDYSSSDFDSCYDSMPYPGSLSVSGEFLYWQPTVTGMPYALTRTSVALPFGPFGPGVVPDNISVKNVNFDYAPGFRVLGRYTFSETQWDVDTTYTQFKTNGRDSIASGDGTFIDTL